MSADQLKNDVLDYISERYPNFRAASVVVDVGEDIPHEVLVVLPTQAAAQPDPIVSSTLA